MECIPEDYALQTLLDLDGRSYWLEKYWVKFEVRPVEKTIHRPHGLKYSITLHDRNNSRVLGFDNAHQMKRRGRRTSKYTGRVVTWDHIHRCEKEEYYVFSSATQLLSDFWDAANKIMGE